MSSNIENEHDPVANLNLQPTKSILKSKRSIDDIKPETVHETIVHSTDHCPTTGMTRSESKSHKIPHFDEMNIIATYHPVDKDYGHMKIEEPKTPYAPNDMIDEEMSTETYNAGIDPDTLAQRLNQSTVPPTSTSQFHCERRGSTPTDDDMELTPQELEHRKQFEHHRKKHYNEFEVVRLRKKEIEEELRALEREEQTETPMTISKKFEDNGHGNPNMIASCPSSESIKPILVHHNSTDSSGHHHHHHVHVEANADEDQTLTPEERERKRQFEMKRKKHYNEFRVVHLADKINDDEPDTTG